MRQCALALVFSMIVGGAARTASCADGAEPQGPFANPAGKNAAAAIAALGTVVPENMAEVFAQVPGQIVSLGPGDGVKGESIDFGSPVAPGTVLAQIDRTRYTLRVVQRQADCKCAEAKLVKAKALRDFARAQWGAGPEERQWQATVREGLRQVASQLCRRRCVRRRGGGQACKGTGPTGGGPVNLSYTVLKSPIKGVAIDRRINVGQMAAAGPDSPGLFSDRQSYEVADLGVGERSGHCADSPGSACAIHG